MQTSFLVCALVAAASAGWTGSFDVGLPASPMFVCADGDVFGSSVSIGIRKQVLEGTITSTDGLTLEGNYYKAGFVPETGTFSITLDSAAVDAGFSGTWTGPGGPVAWSGSRLGTETPQDTECLSVVDDSAIVLEGKYFELSPRHNTTLGWYDLCVQQKKLFGTENSTEYGLVGLTGKFWDNGHSLLGFGYFGDLAGASFVMRQTTETRITWNFFVFDVAVENCTSDVDEDAFCGQSRLDLIARNNKKKTCYAGVPFPGKPRNVDARARAAGMLLDWVPSRYGQPAELYQIQRKEVGSGEKWQTAGFTVGPELTYMDTGTTGGSVYKYRIRGIRANTVDPLAKPLKGTWTKQIRSPVATN